MRRKTEYGGHFHFTVLLCAVMLLLAALSATARADLEYAPGASGSLTGGQPLTAVIAPVASTAEALAPLLPAEVRLPDLYAGEFCVYDVTVINSLTGEPVHPEEELPVILSPGFGSVEKLHAYYIYNGSSAVEIYPEITPAEENGRQQARISFTTEGGRYVFFSEGSLWQRVEKHLACLPDYSSLTPQKAREVESAVLRIDELAAELTQPDTGCTYHDLFNGMDWARYNQLRWLLDVFKGVVRPMDAEAEDGTRLSALGRFPESVRLSICAYSPGAEQLAAAAAMLGREPEEMTMYHVSFVSDEELLQPGGVYELYLERPEAYREGAVLLLPGGGDGAHFSAKSASNTLLMAPPCDFALCR